MLNVLIFTYHYPKPSKDTSNTFWLKSERVGATICRSHNKRIRIKLGKVKVSLTQTQVPVNRNIATTEHTLQEMYKDLLMCMLSICGGVNLKIGCMLCCRGCGHGRDYLSTNNLIWKRRSKYQNSCWNSKRERRKKRDNISNSFTTLTMTCRRINCICRTVLITVSVRLVKCLFT